MTSLFLNKSFFRANLNTLLEKGREFAEKIRLNRLNKLESIDFRWNLRFLSQKRSFTRRFIL